jgi:hypothetical protein
VSPNISSAEVDLLSEEAVSPEDKVSCIINIVLKYSTTGVIRKNNRGVNLIKYLTLTCGTIMMKHITTVKLILTNKNTTNPPKYYLAKDLISFSLYNYLKEIIYLMYHFIIVVRDTTPRILSFWNI